MIKYKIQFNQRFLDFSYFDFSSANKLPIFVAPLLNTCETTSPCPKANGIALNTKRKPISLNKNVFSVAEGRSSQTKKMIISKKYQGTFFD